MKTISVRGAEEHNLKNVDIDIPKNSLVVFTGVSGSGKSSLVFDTIYAEAFRRFADSSQVPIYVMGSSIWSRLSRPRFRSLTGLPPALGLSQRQGVAGRLSTVGTVSGVSDLFRVYFAVFGEIFCRKCDISLRALNFSELIQKIFDQFLNKKIMIISPLAEKRKGGFVNEIEKFRQLGFSKIRINGNLLDLQEDKIKIDAKKLNTIDVVIDYLSVTQEKKQRIDRAVLQALEYGKGVIKIEQSAERYVFNTKSSCPQCGESSPKLDPRYFSHSSLGQCPECDGEGSKNHGLPADLFPCPNCFGSRLNPKRPIVRLYGKTYEELHQLKLDELIFFTESNLKLEAKNDKAKAKVYTEIERSLQCIVKLGLNHLILNRAASSLSPGDLQRLRLSSMISNKLTGVLYVVDEPCQGLTQLEVKKLISVFKELLKDGASILAVEHHPTFLEDCDCLILMGPGAGVHGGTVVATATDHAHLKDLLVPLQHRQSNTKNAALTPLLVTKAMPPKKSLKKKDKYASLEPPQTIKEDKEKSPSLVFSEIKFRNLGSKKIKIYQGIITILRGPSGSGKSTFLELCLLPALYSLGGNNTDEDEEARVPFQKFTNFQSNSNIIVNTVGYVRPGSLTRSSKRIVAAALEVIKPLREIFAKLPQSQVMGLTESHFSWNSKLGRCEKCEGRGYIELPQKYAQPVRVECEYCLGAKLTSRSLLPRYKGYNLADVMNSTLDQVSEIFANHKLIANRIQRACQFGLGYVQLGQGMDTLSGGELQRLNLTIELKRSSLEGAWFVLMHPSTGLHEPDIEILGELMRVMTENGATFVLIENREEFLKFAHNVVSFE